MAVQPLSAEHSDQLRSAPLSYQAVGATAGTPPPGYRYFSRTRILSRRDYESVAEDLMTWRVQVRAGLRVAASSPRAEQDAVVDMRLGIGAVALRIPCRVVYVIDEPRRSGFAYGTLPGHPESGEELFLLQRRDDGQIAFTITAFSREASITARLVRPVGRWLQHAMTGRYLESVDQRGQ